MKAASIDNILPTIKEHGDVTILDVLYYEPYKKLTKKERESGKKPSGDNVLFIIYKDGQHQKHVQAIRNPEMDIYFIKPEYRSFKTPREYIELDKCYAKRCRPSGVVNTIFEEIQKSDDPISKHFAKLHESAMNNYKSVPYTDETRDVKSVLRQHTRNVLLWPYTLFSDVDLESYYRILLGNRYNLMRGHTVDKCFLDIESDIFGLTSSQTNENDDKTNACTLIFHFDPNGPRGNVKPQVYTFLLRDYKRYPQQRHFELHLDDFIEACHKNFDKQTVIVDGKKKVVDTEADYHILLYNTEIELIQNIFKTIHGLHPDICEVWNIAYDIPKLKARIEKNGYNPLDIMCDPRWDTRYRYIEDKIDNRPIDIAERKTSVQISGTTLFSDQMQTYAGIRKGRKAYGSNSLDNISSIELGMGKWKFKPGVDVTNAAILDYWNFVLYNIRDVWCQDLIDYVTNDSMSVIYDMNQSFCPLRSLFKQITYQRQIYYTQRLNRGFLSGNNPNINYMRGETEEMLEARHDMEIAAQTRRRIDDEVMNDDDDNSENYDDNPDNTVDTELNDIANEKMSDIVDIYKDSIHRDLKLQGGLVGNPNQNLANGTEFIDGLKSKHIQDDVQDMDYASEYPWAKYTRSMSKSTQFGRLIIPDKISDRQNSLPMGMTKRFEDMKYYTPGAEFTSDYISNDVVQFGNVWFGLPTVDELSKMLSKEGADLL